NGKLLAIAAAGQIRLRDIVRDQDVATLVPKLPSPVSGLAFDQEGKVLAVGHYIRAAGGVSSQVALWDVEKRQQTATLPIGDGRIWRLAFSRNGQFLAATTLNSPRITLF